MLLNEAHFFNYSSATDSNQNNADESVEEDYYYDSEDELKKQILDTALSYVPEHGWSHQALKCGAEAEGLSSAVEGLFPNGPGDLVLHFIEDCNSRLAEQLLEESKQHKTASDYEDIP